MGRAIRLRAGNIETAKRTYQRDSRKVTLIGVTHIADAQFWDALNYCIDGLGCEVHFEGIGKPKGESSLGAYGELADFLKLLDQPRGLNYEKHWKRTDLTWDELSEALGAKKLERMERSATKGWDALTDAKEAGVSWRTARRALVLILGLMPTVPNKVLLDQRNDVAVKHIEEAGADVCAVWGAGHLSGIGNKLRANGWTLTSEVWDVAITGAPESTHKATKMLKPIGRGAA
ncbi:TraB/GumN family protein [Arthrobacter sp. MDT1-65]